MTEPEIVDGEQVTVDRGPIETTAMTLDPPAKMDLQDASDHGLKIFEERVKNAKRMMKLALTLASPSQFIVMESKGRQSVYATAGAADRILRQGFGMRWGPVDVRIEKQPRRVGTPDEYEVDVAIARADLIQQSGDVYENREGRREIGGFVKNENDLVKAAVQNMKARAVSDIMGFRFMSPEDFLEMGLDLSKLQRRVEFRDNKGDVGDDQPRVTFGKNTGKLLSELSDRSLDWYLEAAQKAIDDPEKQRWLTNNKKWLVAVTAEHEKRNSKGDTAATEAPKESTEPAPDYTNVGPPPMEQREPGED